MPSVPTPSKSGIIEDNSTGERHIPSSQRADGTTRREIKIRPGYKPPEDVEVYKNRTAEGFRTRGGGGVPGAESVVSSESATTASNSKNAKRREARRRAKESDDKNASNDQEKGENEESGEVESAKPAEAAPDAAVEREKKARNLKKKLKQAKDLRDKKEGGAALLPEQFAKVIKINELIRELDMLGFDQEGEPKSEDQENATAI